MCLKLNILLEVRFYLNKNAYTYMLARRMDDMWTKEVLTWYARECKRVKGRLASKMLGWNYKNVSGRDGWELHNTETNGMTKNYDDINAKKYSLNVGLPCKITPYIYTDLYYV